MTPEEWAEKFMRGEIAKELRPWPGADITTEEIAELVRLVIAEERAACAPGDT